MPWIDVEGWTLHGRAWRGKNGRLSFYIRREGRDIKTGAATLPGALEALERFEKTGEAQLADSQPIFLDVALAAEFLEASKAKGNSRGWRVNQRAHLQWWAERLRGRDLRAGRRASVAVGDIRTALADAPSARQREAVLRALYTHLRATDRVATSEDPTFGKPRITPPARPAQEKVDKSISLKSFEIVRKHLEAQYLKSGRTGRRWADLITILDATGVHVTELQRFASGGEFEPLPSGRRPSKMEAEVLVFPMHKSGAPHRVAVSKATAAVARRVRDAGSFSMAVLYKVLREAEKVTGAKVLPGRFRHTAAKHAVEAGATMGEVATFLGHKSQATTKRFYATLGVPVKVPTRR